MKKLFGCLALIILIIIAILLFVLLRNRAEPAAQSAPPVAQQQSSGQPGAPSQPTIQIVSPANGARVRVGQQFQVHVIATDATGVTTIAFALNGQQGTPITAPSPQKTFSVAIPVVLPNQGIHTIAVQASNASGAKSQPVAVRVVALQNLSDPTNPGDPPAPVPDVPTDPVLSSGNLPAPVNITVNFSANPPSIAQGQCSTLRWAVEGAREVYFEGVGVTGNEQQQQCPTQTTTYTLTVVFQDGSARNYTATVTVTAAQSGGQPPAAPTNLRVTSTTKTTARIAWTDNADNETGFEIGIEGRDGLSANANATQIEATGLTCNRAYNFRVRALSAAGNSAWSNIVTAQTLACDQGPQPPTPPSNLRQATTSLVGKVALQWNDNSNNEDAFDIERVAADGTATRVAVANANATGASVDAPPCGSTYQFQVSARNSAGYSAASNKISVAGICASGSGVPAKPANLRVQSVTATASNLTWDDPATNETRFEVLQTGKSAPVAQTNANDHDAQILNSPCAQAFEFRVRACNAQGCSDSSNAASATTPACPTKPLVITGVKVTITPENFSGPCPYKVNLSGTISATGTGTVKYQWVLNGEAQSVHELAFDGAATKAVAVGTWTVKSGTHTARLKVLDQVGEPFAEDKLGVFCSN